MDDELREVWAKLGEARRRPAHIAETLELADEEFGLTQAAAQREIDRSMAGRKSRP